MLSHGRIWAALDTLAARHGLTTSGLARLAGLDPTTFNKSKRMGKDGRERWPSTESLAKVLQATGESLHNLYSLIAADYELDLKNTHGQIPQRPIPMIGFSDIADTPALSPETKPETLPWETIWLRAPSHGMYALEINDDKYAPVYLKGDLLLIAPHEDIRAGDRLITKVGLAPLAPFFCHAIDEKSITVSPIADHGRTNTLPRSTLAWMARIVWVSQ